MPTEPQASGARRAAAALLWVATALAAAWSLGRMFASPAAVNWTQFSAILLLACIGSRLRVQLPGLDRPVSLAPSFAFAGVVALHPLAAWSIVVLAEAFESFTAGGWSGRPWGHAADRVFSAIAAAPAIFAAAAVFHGLDGASEIEWAVAALLASATWFATIAAAHTLRAAIRQGGGVGETWNRTWFWAAPVYLLAPFGALVVKLLTEAASGWDALLGLAVVSMVYWYVRTYFPRVNEQRDHAEQLAEVRQRALETLAVAIEAKDGSTAGHLRRVTRLAVLLAERLECRPAEIRTLQLAAVLHDVGKVGVPDYILQKPSRLTDREFREITAHASIGAGIVAAMRFPEPVDEVVLSHHEHWDGSGYPRGLAGEAIPRLARVLTVVDCFDALVSDRPYRKALTIDSALDLMRRQRGKIFDPAILDAFLELAPRVASELEQDLASESESRRRTPVPSTLRQTWIEGSEHEGLVSARSAALRRLGRRPDHLLAFFETLNALEPDFTADGGFRRALEPLAETSAAKTAHLFEHDTERGVFEWRASAGEDDGPREPLAAGIGPIARAIELRAAVTVELPSERPAERAESAAEAPRSVLIAPLFSGGQLAGLLLLESPRSGAFDEDHLALADLLAEKFASALRTFRRIAALRADASTDPVTALPNARACFERLEHEVDRARRENRPLALLFMDLDGLKPVNDSYGHVAGDRLLATAAARLRTALRGYDFVGRFGGDEFLAILPGVPAERAERLVDEIKRAVSAEPVRLGDGQFGRVSLSIGAAHFPKDGGTAAELVTVSDRRMYADKENSRLAVGAAGD